MVKEYLQNMVVSRECSWNICETKYRGKRKEKESIEARIKRIQSDGNIAVEYFTPRNENQSLRDELKSLKEKLGKIEKELQRLEMERCEIEKDRDLYQTMLKEVEDLEKAASKNNRGKRR